MRAREKSVVTNGSRNLEGELDLGARISCPSDRLQTAGSRDEHTRLELPIAGASGGIHRCIVMRKRFVERSAPIARQSNGSLDRRDSCRIVGVTGFVERALPER